MLINVKTPKPAGKLCQEAKEIGVYAMPVFAYTDDPGSTALIFYYNRIPLKGLKEVLTNLLEKWKS